ncbi:MAG: low molecular weight phosphotyrosine protein phosphatase [Thiobacillaceae bacterium]|jgi:protein-tyrosine phosphatase|nr:low molecular weight phosphotyrosine protein phosphatase [Thiobacillaceae bacterium]
MKQTDQVAILMVCMGNICRSPTAEGVFRKRLREAGLEHAVRLDSAGTHAYHVGKSPDRRAQQAATGRGYDLSDLVARQVNIEDFTRFDYILAMDLDNLSDLQRVCPQEHRDKLRLFLSFSPTYAGQEVPDPYYGGAQGFDLVLDMVEDAAAGLLDAVRRDLGPIA